MYWKWPRTEDAVFFKFWRIDNDQQLVLSIFLVFLLGVLYEGMNPLRLWVDGLISRAMERARMQSSSVLPTRVNSAACCAEKKLEEAPVPVSVASDAVAAAAAEAKYPVKYQVVRSLLHGVHNFYALFLMMIFMTYNGYLMLAMVFGAAAGFFIFSRGVATSTVTKATSCH